MILDRVHNLTLVTGFGLVCRTRAMQSLPGFVFCGYTPAVRLPSFRLENRSHTSLESNDFCLHSQVVSD